MIDAHESVTVNCKDCDREYDVTFEPYFKGRVEPVDFNFCLICGGPNIKIKKEDDIEGEIPFQPICGECGEDPEDCAGHFGSNLRELFYGARPLAEIMGAK